MHTPVLLQESKRLTHIKITDEDYFDVDFSFEQLNTDPKAIYIKRKHFKDINPKILNPENVLTTDAAQQQIQHTLQQEPRYLAFIHNTHKTASLSYLLPNITQQKIAKASTILANKPKEDGLYFKLLREDRLELFELYMALSREANQM